MKFSHIVATAASAAYLVTLGTPAFGQNLLINGSFETEDASVVTQTYGTLGVDPAPSGWTFVQSDQTTWSYVESNADTSAPEDSLEDTVTAQDGDWYIAFGPYGATGAPTEADYDALTQAVQTQAGANYTLSCWEYSLGGDGTAGDGVYFNLTWNGQVVPGSQISDAQTPSGWNQYSFTVVGTGGMDEVGVHGYSNAFYAAVDNVSLTAQAVPEPSAFAALGLGLVGLFFKRRK